MRLRAIRQAEIAEATRAAFLSEGKDYLAVVQGFKDTAEYHATGVNVGAIRAQATIDENWEAAKRRVKGKKR